jgi:hypothetical protein
VVAGRDDPPLFSADSDSDGDSDADGRIDGVVGELR